MGRGVVVARFREGAPHFGHDQFPSLPVPLEELSRVGACRQRAGLNHGLERAQVHRQRNAVHLDFFLLPLVAKHHQELHQIRCADVRVGVFVGVVRVVDLGCGRQGQQGQKERGKLLHWIQLLP